MRLLMVVVAVMVGMLPAACKTRPAAPPSDVTLFGQIPADAMAYDDWPPWVTVARNATGWDIVSEYCPGRTKTITSTGGEPRWQDARLALYFAKALRRTEAECAQLEASDAAIAENQAAAANACRTVFVMEQEPDVVAQRRTCPGDDLWDVTRVNRCGDMRLADEAENSFACRSIAVGADSSYTGSPEL